MCMDTLLLRVEHAPKPGRVWMVVRQYIPQSRRVQCEDGQGYICYNVDDQTVTGGSDI